MERDSRGNAAQKACSKGAAEIGDPQRQRIAEFAAVAERDCSGNAAQKACSKGAAEIGDPQRQRIAEFAAVAVPGKDSRVSGTFLGGYLSYLLCVLFVPENSYLRKLRIFARF